MENNNTEELKRMLRIISPSYNIVKHTFCEGMNPVDAWKDHPKYRREVLLEWDNKEG